jgi:hypothetical protein
MVDVTGIEPVTPCNNVAARIHSLDGLPPKLITVPWPFFSIHFTAPFPQSVHHKTISL